jgi:hypothetical protein
MAAPYSVLCRVPCSVPCRARHRVRGALLLAGAASLLLAVQPSAAQQAAAPLTYPAAFDQPMPLSTTLGTVSRPITTSSPTAQAYFDQGMRLLYAFTTQDAARSFREAQKHDPACAMCYFGEAWAWGPYLNGAMQPASAPRAHAAIQQAQRLKDGASPVERALTRTRWSASTGSTRGTSRWGRCTPSR